MLLILVDDLRFDLGSYGNRSVRTPAIDRLAAEGVRFDRAYAQYPACNPSRTSLLTGLRPDTTGVLDNRTPFPSRIPDAVTLPAAFRAAGYFTASVGKVFHGSGRKGRWTDPEAWDLESFPRAAGGPRARSDESSERGWAGRYSWRSVGEPRARLGDERVATRTVEILEQKRERPFFLAVGFTATHPHFEAPERFFDHYPMDSIDLPPPPPPALAALQVAMHGWSDESSNPMSDTQKRELIRAYRACLSFVDAQVEIVLQALSRLGLADKTIVVLTSDHGYHLGEQGWWSKHTLYETATRVPMIVRDPRAGGNGSSTAAIAELVDLYPTLTELAGIESPEALEGRSLAALLEDPGRSWQGAALSQVSLDGIDGRSVRTDRWRYTEWRGDRSSTELYDLTNEPIESHNLASDPDLEEVRRRLAALLE